MQTTKSKKAPFKAATGGLRGSKAVPSEKFRPMKKGMKNEC